MSDLGEAATPRRGRRTTYRRLRPGPGRERDEVLANQRSRLVAATIELVAEQGYDGTTVRDIARLAGVSKASFYEQFSGKDDCFLATCDTALRATASAVLRGECTAGEGRDRLRAGLSALADLIVAQPKATRLVLIDGVASSPAIRDHVRRRFGLLEVLVRERLATVGQGDLPKPLVTGIVRGIAHHVRRCVLAECPDQLQDLVDPLLDWALGFDCEKALAVFAAPAVPIRVAGPVAGDRVQAAGTPAPQGTRDLLLAATLRLASREGCAALTPTRIRRAAGVSRRSFDAHFDDATSCFLAAVEAELGMVLAEALQAIRADADWGGRTCLVLDGFAASLADAPELTRLTFAESLDAAPASLLWRERLVARWAETLYRDAPAGSRPSPAVAEATIAAIWGFLADLVAARRLHLLPAQGARLAFFALAPVLGARGAVETIEAARETEAVALRSAVYGQIRLSSNEL
jgi:AcrR family transcriptional regulator